MSAPQKSSLKIGGPLETNDFEFDGERILAHRQPEKSIPMADVVYWRQVFLCLGVWDIHLQLIDGRTLEWNDAFGHLLAILKRAEPEKELPYTHR